MKTISGNNDKYNKYIPLDKSWITRMGVLDIIHGYNDIEIFLNKKTDLNDDLLALKNAGEAWRNNVLINVGESATLYRLLQFASWKLNLNKIFIKEGTLKDRKIINNPSIVNLNLKELLKLDNQTTQWATASVIMGNKQRIQNPPNKLQQTYDAVDHWNKQRQAGLVWEPQYDETIQKQVETFLDFKNGLNVIYIPVCSDDYCFARVFGCITKEEGKKNWPSLEGHETNRIKEMEKVIEETTAGNLINSKDHRVIQAMAMWGVVNNRKLNFKYKEAVNKSWPKFWDFLDSLK
ncbi:MAG: hypothetical protein WCW93_00045 [Candidatus Paceibacterota bacterium]